MDLIVRRVPHSQNRIYLTFDDGPDPIGTPRILNVLKIKKIPATFFVVAKKIEAQPELIERIRSEGHAFGDHSLDHTYSAFFKSEPALRDWLQASQKIFKQKKIPTVGFRPPAGVVTPMLKTVLRDQQRPLILWDQRFYDTVIPWNKKLAIGSIPRLRPGSIILLHDRQPQRHIDRFCETLADWSDRIRDRGYEFALLPNVK